MPPRARGRIVTRPGSGGRIDVYLVGELANIGNRRYLVRPNEMPIGQVLRGRPTAPGVRPTARERRQGFTARMYDLTKDGERSTFRVQAAATEEEAVQAITAYYDRQAAQRGWPRAGPAGGGGGGAAGGR